MLLDGFWKKDLDRIQRSMKIWSRIHIDFLRDYAEHKINQGMLFSAIIIRKIVEDEFDAERVIKRSDLPMLPLPVIKIKVPVKQYEYVGKEELFINNRVILQDYNWDTAVDKAISLNDVCNQIIHSYLWSIVYLNSKRVFEILLVSDRAKDKVVYALTIDEWIKAIRKVVKKANI